MLDLQQVNAVAVDDDDIYLQRAAAIGQVIVHQQRPAGQLMPQVVDRQRLALVGVCGWQWMTSMLLMLLPL